jgi:hypothetical protein
MLNIEDLNNSDTHFLRLAYKNTVLNKYTKYGFKQASA